MSAVSAERERDDELIAAALAARDHAYAPYSEYPVGCAVLAGGEIYTGVNVENASFGLTMCAEQSATAAAVTAGHSVLDTVVVVTQSSPPATPCGTCRQVLREFAKSGGATRVIVVNAQGERRDFTLAELLPHSFSGDQLTK